MDHANPTQAKHTPLLRLFLNGYETMRRHMELPCRDALLELAPLAFGKWYNTALAADTILSPDNILSLEWEDAAQDGEAAYVMRIDRAAQQRGLSPYAFTLLHYSAEAHPFVEDLQRLVAYCTPDRAVDAAGFLLPEEQAPLLETLSQGYPFYLEYLTRLAWLQGLLIPLPAIHTRRVQPAPACAAFFAQDTAAILTQLGETACALAAERFTETLELESGIATTAFFRELLEGHQDVDQIFIDFYRQVDVEITEIWKTPPDQLTEEEHALVSSFLFTGVLLDKWFLTPMSLFFRFIRPINFTPIRFFYLVNHLAALVLLGRDAASEVFTPATCYSLTPLGARLFAPQGASGQDRQKMPRSLSYAQLLSAVEEETRLRAHEQLFLMEAVPEIAAIRITDGLDADLWETVEIALDMDLHRLCLEVCALFGAAESADYLLSVPDANGFPVEYAPQGSKRALNKTTGKTLQSLALEAGDTLTLYPTAGKGFFLTLEVLEQGAGSPYLLYPRIIRQSETIAALEQAEERF